MVKMGNDKNKKFCPVCRMSTSDYEMYCICGYEFGSNRCTNPYCKKICGDFVCFCPNCGTETENYLNGDIGIAVPTNVT